MFGLFSKKDPNRCPVNENDRIWLEHSFFILLGLFGQEATKKRKVLIPHHSNFPIKYTGEESTAFETLKIVAEQMEIAFEDIQLDFFDDRVKKISTGSPFGQGIYLKSENNDSGASGHYWGRQQDGKYHISLNKATLKQPENMVATLAHEIAHIKLLGENRIEQNDEKLTDLATVFFGFGIFKANAAFQTYTGIDYHGWRKAGYLSQMEWGYALALFAHVREEKTPDWINHLTPNIKNDFKQGEKFINSLTLDKTENEAAAETAIEGKWEGQLTYDHGYPKNYQNKLLHFSLDLKLEGSCIKGLCEDDITKESALKPAVIEGTYKDGDISFIKKYSCKVNVDEEGSLLTDPVLPSHEIQYKGKWFRNFSSGKIYCAGNWNITNSYINESGVTQQYIAGGKWRMSRV